MRRSPIPAVFATLLAGTALWRLATVGSPATPDSAGTPATSTSTARTDPGHEE